MKLQTCAVAIIASFTLLAARDVEAGSAPVKVVVPVVADASVNAANPDANLNTLTTRGGLFSGLDGTGSDYHFYLKFNLPTFTPGTTITEATLKGVYTDAYSGVHSFHGVYLTSDAWDESTLTFNNAPSATSESFAGFETADVTPPSTMKLIIGLVADTEYRGDGVLSLLVSTIDGRFEDLAYFGSKEFNSAEAFSLELTISPTTTAVPLPSAAASVAGMFAMLFVARRWLPNLNVVPRAR